MMVISTAAGLQVIRLLPAGVLQAAVFPTHLVSLASEAFRESEQ